MNHSINRVLKEPCCRSRYDNTTMKQEMVEGRKVGGSGEAFLLPSSSTNLSCLRGEIKFGKGRAAGFPNLYFHVNKLCWVLGRKRSFAPPPNICYVRKHGSLCFLVLGQGSWSCCRARNKQTRTNTTNQDHKLPINNTLVFK